ncbi:hypothetical protein PV08_01231 [Exophiala spinifera]|uniref:BTB domain-containing protein n=1 Tax=Exophiala spinifera TaxID=91928 RepID=A0A0D2CAQ1_9EURO|nr:uncharacterized protein PV08_01231 [Exophiala spinifera]KIW20654.1 hypothetical protein PV08_01231 [Exophiala spinifera]
MDAQHRPLFIKWSQSQRVSLSVVRPDGETETLVIPGELLRRRSRKFRDVLTCYVSGMPVPDTSLDTMHDFYMWTMDPKPHVYDDTTFDKAVKLGIFASRYEIPALSNQVTDVIRGKLASGDWKLGASMVDEIYQAVPVGRPLREVVRAALGLLPRSITTDPEEPTREDWAAVILKHGHFALDFIQATSSEWTLQAYLSNVCRFHDHEDMGAQSPSSASCDGCRYAQDECYPTGGQEALAKVNGEKEAPGEEPVGTGESSDKTYYTAEEAAAPEPEPEPEALPELVPEPEAEPEQWLEPIAEEPALDYEEAPQVAYADHLTEHLAELQQEPLPAYEEPAREPTPVLLAEPVYAETVDSAPPAPESVHTERPFNWADDEEPVSEIYGVAPSDTNEVAVSEVNAMAPSEVSGITSESNGSVASHLVVKEVAGEVVASESPIEEVDTPVVVEAAVVENGHAAGDKKLEQSAGVETPSEPSKKKKKKKNRGNSVSQVK